MKRETKYRIRSETNGVGSKRFYPQKKLWWWFWNDMTMHWFYCETDARRYIDYLLHVLKARSSITIDYLPYH